MSLPSKPPTIEIIAPLGTTCQLEAVYLSGAHAVYLGVKGHSSRPDEFAFSIDKAAVVVQQTKTFGVRAYLALNAEMREPSGQLMRTVLEQIDDLQADGLILGDLGCLALARELRLRTPIHVSSLLGVYNSATVRVLRDWGITRIVLPTTLYVHEIADITLQNPGMEFELIIQNGVCFQDSWRCGFHHRIREDGGFDVQCKHTYNLELDGAVINHGRLLWEPDIDCALLLPILLQLGVTHFKIEGRTRTSAQIIESVGRVKSALNYWQTLCNGGANFFYAHYLLHPSRLGLKEP